MTDTAATAVVAAPQKVTITLSRDDLKAPVYVAGSFTKIPWEPEEMDIHPIDSENTSISFTKTFNISPGVYHYKFRLGDGDWWICDEQRPIVRDEAGNSNNQLTVVPTDGEKSRTFADSQSLTSPIDTTQKSISTPLVSTVSHDSDQSDKETSVSDHDGFLGTWEPLEERSPMHRRASTNLGVRISRMGTFLPPTVTSDEDDKDEDLEVFPSDRKSILARMETLKNELPEDDSLHLEKTSSADSLHGSTKHISNSVATTRQNKVDANGTMEVGPMLPGTSISTNNYVYDQSKDTTIGPSYGTIAPDLPKDLTIQQPTTEQSPLLQHTHETQVAQTAQAAVPDPTTSTEGIRHRRNGSEVSRDSIAEEKSKLNAEEERSRSILLLTIITMVAGWVQKLWHNLFGPREHKRDDPVDSHP